jgi:hypothetical protein
MSVATDQLLDVVTRFVDEEAMPAVATYDREDSGRRDLRPRGLLPRAPRGADPRGLR